ncbi:MAG: hypothetical protein ABIB04_03870 [Patescibacteria group bacterium]
MNKEEWKEEKARRQDALKEFETKNAAELEAARHLLAENERLRRLAWAGAPEGHARCYGYDEESDVDCDKVVPLREHESVPVGWCIRTYGCGCSEPETMFCPAHAHQAREDRCAECSR